MQAITFLENSISVAAHAHRGQLDKAGKPYILHCIRVMQNVVGVDRQVVAMLHDVVEDTEITIAYLRQLGFMDHHLDAIEALTKRQNETRIEAAHRAGKTEFHKIRLT